MTVAETAKTTTEKARAAATEAEQAGAPERADGIETQKTTGMKAYMADRNLAEVNANEVFYMDPKSDLGKRLLASGYVTETDDPQE
jgi:hypothetical protein